MTLDQPQAKKRSKRIYVFWGVALTLLITAALFCWLVMVPVVLPALSVRKVLVATAPDGLPVFHDATYAHERNTVGKLGGRKQAAARLEPYLRLPDWLAPEKNWAVSLLGHCGEHGVSLLTKLMGHRKSEMRASAARAMARFIEQRADAKPYRGPELNLLTDMLEDPDAEVRSAAASSLASLKWAGRPAIPAVEQAAKREKDKQVRASIDYALQELRAHVSE